MATHGHAWPRLEQKPGEFEWWLQELLLRGTSSLLVIGGAGGVIVWHVARRFREASRRIAITSLAHGQDAERVRAHDDAGVRFEQQLTAIGDTRPSAPMAALGMFDAEFIDGEHHIAPVATISAWR